MVFKLKFLLKRIDLFGFQTYLRIKNKKKHTTAFGGFLTIILIGLCLSLFFIFATDMIYYRNPSSLFSEIYETKPSPIYFSKNKNFFMLGIQNELYQHFIDNSYYNIKLENRVLQKSMDGDIYNVTEIEIERCTEDHFPSEKTLKTYFNVAPHSNPENLYCVKKEILEDLKIEGTFDSPIYSHLFLTVEICKNSTYDNKCKSIEEIKSNIVYFALYSIDYLINPNDHSSPGLNIGKDYFSHLSIGSKVFNSRFIALNEIRSEEGWLLSDIHDYLFPTIKQDKELLILNSEDVVFEMAIRCNHSKMVYMRTYKNLAKVLAECGGFIQIMSIICYIFNYPYSYRKYLLKISNSVFNFEKSSKNDRPHQKKISAKKVKLPLIDQIKSKLKFSFCSLLCPACIGGNFEERLKFYQFIKASSFIKRRLNFTTILQKFMEFDKLKLLLFDKDQYQIFEYLPKPIISKSCDIDFGYESADFNKMEEEEKNSSDFNERIIKSLTFIKNKKKKSDIDFKLLKFMRSKVNDELDRKTPWETGKKFRKIKNSFEMERKNIMNI